MLEDIQGLVVAEFCGEARTPHLGLENLERGPRGQGGPRGCLPLFARVLPPRQTKREASPQGKPHHHNSGCQTNSLAFLGGVVRLEVRGGNLLRVRQAEVLPAGAAVEVPALLFHLGRDEVFLDEVRLTTTPAANTKQPLDLPRLRSCRPYSSLPCLASTPDGWLSRGSHHRPSHHRGLSKPHHNSGRKHQTAWQAWRRNSSCGRSRRSRGRRWRGSGAGRRGGGGRTT